MSYSDCGWDFASYPESRMSLEQQNAAPVPIIIVSYRNVEDVLECLASLANANSSPRFDAYICENGGDDAFNRLCAALADEKGPCCTPLGSSEWKAPRFVAIQTFQLRGSTARVFVGNAGDNVGYAGGVNRWLGTLAMFPDWQGVLILNPDTALDPNALLELVNWSRRRNRGMVTGRIVLADHAEIIHTRGLQWRPFMAGTAAVDRYADAKIRPNPDEIERRIDAPSGAAIYVTRSCVEKVGLMEEKYFLYYEDLEWGMRAKRLCGIGYAFDAIIYHKGGTTIGTGTAVTSSPLATFLEFRNRLLFVAASQPRWYMWTVCVSIFRALYAGLRGRPRNMNAALRGIVDGLSGRTGRPDRMLSQHNSTQDKCE